MRVEADDVLDLLHRLLGLRARKVDLVYDGDEFEVVLDGEVCVGERLRLDALRRVHHEQRALARGERARDFVAEIYVAGSVYEVEDVLLPVLRAVVEADCVRLNRDAALALQVHVVQNLRLHLPFGERARQLQQAVGERRLAVVYVRDYREVSDSFGIHFKAVSGQLSALSLSARRALNGSVGPPDSERIAES